jgi:hypothetical protein
VTCTNRTVSVGESKVAVYLHKHKPFYEKCCGEVTLIAGCAPKSHGGFYEDAISGKDPSRGIGSVHFLVSQ